MKSKSLPISVLAILLGVVFIAVVPKISAQDLSKNTSKNTLTRLQQARINPATGTVDVKDVKNAYEQARLLNTKSVDLAWESKGPINVAGCVSAVLIDRQDATNKTIILGSPAGGLWKSTNGGTNWNPIEFDENLFVTCLSQTTNGTIYIGTGGDFTGTGLYKLTGSTIQSINGTEWESINDIAAKENTVYIATNEGLKYYDGSTIFACKANGEEINENVYEVQVNNAGKIISSVNKSFYYSEGNFDAFVNQSTGEEGKLPLSGSTIGSLSISVDNDNNIFYACVTKANGGLNAIFITLNSGETWEKILQGGGSVDPFVFNNVKYGNIHNKIYSVNCMEGYNALFVAGHDMWFGFRSKTETTGFFDFGTNAVTYSLTDHTSPLYLHSFVNDMAFINSTSTYALFATDGGVYSSDFLLPTIGYITFNKLNLTLNNTLVNNISVDGFNNPVCGTNGTSVLLLNKNNNHETMGSPMWTLGGSSDLYTLEGESDMNFASLIYDDFFFNTSTINQSFAIRRTYDNGYSYNDMTDGANDDETTPSGTIYDVLHWETFNAEHTADTCIFYAYKNTDSTISTHYNNWAPGDIVWGLSKNNEYPVPYELEEQLEHGDSVLIPDRVQTRTFFALDRVVYMVNGILDFSKYPTWERLASVPNSAGNVRTLAVSENCETLYFGTEKGKVFRIDNIDIYYVNEDTAITFNHVEIANFPGQIVTSISVNNQNKDHIVVTLGNYGFEDYIFESTNATSAEPIFNSIKHDLPTMPVYTSIMPKDRNGELVIGTDLGLYTKGAGETSWAQDQTIKNIMVTKIIQQTIVREGMMVPQGVDESLNSVIYQYYTPSENNGCLYVSTYGKGIYRSDIYKTAPVVNISENNYETAIESLRIYPNPVSYAANIEISVNSMQKAELQVFDMQGRCIEKQNITLQKGKNVYDIDFSNYKAGIYIVRAVYGNNTKSAKVIKNF